MALEAAHQASLTALIAADDARMQLLRAAAALGLPDCWIGAGFVRSAVWDRLHGYPASASWGDIDVVWFDRHKTSPGDDAEAEERLVEAEPSVRWSVKNQARMHGRNGDLPYRSAEDAIGRWPETATAVALRLNGDGIEILSPHGLGDLFSMVVRPTPAFIGIKRPVFQERVRAKGWLGRWPLLRVLDV